jgi:hypothetical protein
MYEGRTGDGGVVTTIGVGVATSGVGGVVGPVAADGCLRAPLLPPRVRLCACALGTLGALNTLGALGTLGTLGRYSMLARCKPRRPIAAARVATASPPRRRRASTAVGRPGGLGHAPARPLRRQVRGRLRRRPRDERRRTRDVRLRRELRRAARAAGRRGADGGTRRTAAGADSRGAQGVLKGYSRGTQGVLKGRA